MFVRLNKWIIVWNLALTLALLASLAANAMWAQAAADPPVKVSTGTLSEVDVRGGHDEGSFIAPPLEISHEDSATVLAQTKINVGGHKHTCLVTGSAEVDQSNDQHSTLQFTLTQDSTNGIDNKPAHRRVEFWPYSEGAPTRAEVTSVMGFDSVSGTHTFYFLGRRNDGTSAPANVSAAGILVMCVEHVPQRRD